MRKFSGATAIYCSIPAFCMVSIYHCRETRFVSNFEPDVDPHVAKLADTLYETQKNSHKENRCHYAGKGFGKS